MRKSNQVPKYRYIYLITNLINNKTYIGQHSPKIDEDFNDYYGSGKLIKEAIQKYGKENFSKQILFEKDNVTIEEISEVEKYYIQQYKSNGKAEYNIGSGGEGWNSTQAGKYANTPKQRKGASDRMKEFNKIYWTGKKKSKESIEKQKAFWKSQSEEDIQKQERCKNGTRLHNKIMWSDPEKRANLLEKMKDNPALSSEFKKGRKWYHNDTQEFFTNGCPDGCTLGRLPKNKN